METAATNPTPRPTRTARMDPVPLQTPDEDHRCNACGACPARKGLPNSLIKLEANDGAHILNHALGVDCTSELEALSEYWTPHVEWPRPPEIPEDDYSLQVHPDDVDTCGFCERDLGYRRYRATIEIFRRGEDPDWWELKTILCEDCAEIHRRFVTSLQEGSQ